MTFDVAILCSIGTAFAMCLVSLAQDLIAYCTGARDTVFPAPEIALVRAALPEGCLSNGSTHPHAGGIALTALARRDGSVRMCAGVWQLDDAPRHNPATVVPMYRSVRLQNSDHSPSPAAGAFTTRRGVAAD